MNKMLKVIPAIILISGLLMAGCSGGSNQGGLALGRITGCSTGLVFGPQLGRPAPNFQFEDANGKATALSDLRGKPVLINFWATWCGPCIYEMPFIQQVYDEWSGKGLVVLAIDMGESSSKVKKFLRDYSLSFPVLLDTKEYASRGFGVQYIPTTFFVDKNGIIQAVKFGAFLNKAEIEKELNKIIP